MTQPRLLGGRYELDGIVGRGGMAEVFRARDIRLDRIVGVKTLRDDLARDQTFQARFRREAQSAASLNHPSIVAVYDTGEDMMGPTPVPYIVMEFVDGRTLRDLLRDDRRLLPERTVTEWASPQGEVLMVERSLPAAWVGYRLDGLEVLGRVRLTALSRAGRSVLAKPGVVGQEGDVLYVSVTEGALDELEELLEKGPR